jgi:type II secretory pathway pseudopilin PulG
VKLHPQMRHRQRGAAGSPTRASREGGYVLLTLLLLAAVLAFALIVILPDRVFEQKRDREQEMVHRGVQYTRALGAYYKKFGRYPTRLEDLESTNNLRFLRKRYKDPENKNKDFKLLHFGEVKLSLSGGIGGGTIPGASAVGSPGGLNGPAAGAALNGLGAIAQQTGFGGNSNNSFGSSSGSSFGTGSSFSSTSNQPGTSSVSGTDSSQSGPSAPGGSASAQISGPVSDASNAQQQVFGGGPIIGVVSASASKGPTIREYNHKKKYSEWQFVYDPAIDRGGLITTPYQPALSFATLNQPGQNGQPGQPAGANSSPFSSSPFGTNSNSGTSPSPGSPVTPPQPGNPPQQQ